jgi:peptidoglycan/xylan/chitin deacetylase (PgdA/CDA1 family)
MPSELRRDWEGSIAAGRNGARGVRAVSNSDRPGALVISLDFELHWGTRDHLSRQDPDYGSIVEERRAVQDLISVFETRRIRTTWATVGFLFASTWDELSPHLPPVRPVYARRELDPYGEPVGPDEDHDPEHLAGSLVDLIAASPGQEVGSHTFSHYYCLEPGQSEATFRADLAAAQAIAHARGLKLTSLVLPRNQWNPSYSGAVLDLGFRCIRGNQRSRAHRAAPGGGGMRRRAARLADTYVGLSPPPTTAWSEVALPSGLCDVPASAFLRPYRDSRRRLEPLRRARLRSGLRHAARTGRIFHLWWHPHNFAHNRRENLSLLGHVLDDFDELSRTDGMETLTMSDVTDRVRPSGATQARDRQ